MTTNEISHIATLDLYVRRLGDGFAIYDELRQHPLATTRLEDDAKRFAAAWNACDGIATEALEAHGAGCFAAWAVHAKRADDLQAQCDKYRATDARCPLKPTGIGDKLEFDHEAAARLWQVSEEFYTHKFLVVRTLTPGASAETLTDKNGRDRKFSSHENAERAATRANLVSL